MFRIGICDDDIKFSEELKKLVKEYAEKNNISVKVQSFVNSNDLFKSLEEEGLFEILFLDIELKETTGVIVGKRIRSDIKNEAMQIVFVSSKQGYAMQLFEIRPMNFLIKPIDYKKVSDIMNEYGRLYKFQSDFFRYSIGKREYRINEQQIMYFESKGKKIIMVTPDSQKAFYGKLSEVLSDLRANSFCHVHKSYIINMRYVAEYSKDNILMVDGTVIPVSQSMRKNVAKKFLENNI